MRKLFVHSAVMTAALGGASAANADITFLFQEVGSDVTMTSSGTFDTTGLIVVGPFGWGGTGIEENGSTDIMGGTEVGNVDISFAFNAGTDFSQWATANGPWSNSDFSTQVTSGTKGFATYVFDDNGRQVPGLGVEEADMQGALWSPDQTWRWTNESFASLSMIPGTYSVSDSITEETITIQIGIIPAPGALALLGVAGLVSKRRRRD